MSEIPNNSVLEVKLDYIKRDIETIKADVKEMKSDYISRTEANRRFEEIEKSFNDRINPVQRFVYGIIGVIGVALIGAILNLIIKK